MLAETKVGLLVVAGIVLLMGMSAFLGNVDIFSGGGFEVALLLDDASGVVKNSQVRYRGIEVGKITGITMDSATGRVVVYAKLRPDIAVPSNVIIRLGQDGLIGSKFIELVPPDVASGAYMQSNGVYDNFRSAVSIDDMADAIYQVADSMSLMIKENRAQIKSIVDNIDTLTFSLGSIASEQNGNIKEMIANLHDMSYSMKSFTNNLDTLLARNKGNLEETMQNLNSALAKINSVAENLDKLTAGINDGQGTVGWLMTDNESRDDLKQTVTSISDMLGKANKMILEIETGLNYQVSNDDYIGSVGLRITPSDKKFYYLGLTNMPYGRTEKKSTLYKNYDAQGNLANEYTVDQREREEDYIAFSLQYGWLFNKNIGIRAGLFSSRLGIAVDTYLLPERAFTASFEAYDFFRDELGPYYRAMAQYRVTKNLFLQAGWDDMGSSEYNSFFIGGGVTIVDDDLKTILTAMPLTSIAK